MLSQPGSADVAATVRLLDPADPADPVAEWLHHVVADPVVVGRPEQGAMAARRGRAVVEVVAAQEQRLFLKVEPRRGAWRAEVRAYRRWLPALDGLTPRLRAADKRLGTVLTEAVPGVALEYPREPAMRQAGAWLRRLHDVRPARPARSKAWAVRRAERLAERHPGVFEDRELAFVVEQARVVEHAGATPEVPSHGDFRQHNWLLGEDGVLRVIDFGTAQWAPPTFDLSGLAYGPWWRAPALKGAFLEGYGRDLTPDEEAVVAARVCLRAARNIARGHDRGVPLKVEKGRARLAGLMGDVSS